MAQLQLRTVRLKIRSIRRRLQSKKGITLNLVSSERSLRAAEIILDCNLVKVSHEKPFVLTSGWHSPVYINIRGLLSHPQARNEINVMMANHLENHVGRDALDVLAGGETAGIPLAAMVAEVLRQPMVYVRKKPKEFGMTKQIEGGEIDGRDVILIEDLTTDGKSKIDFAEVIRRSGGTIAHTISVFFYGVYPDVDARMKEAGLTLHYLCEWKSILDVARSQERFAPSELDAIGAFLDDPIAWSDASKAQLG